MTIETIVTSPARHGGSELKRIDYLDGWRGLAIFLVLQGHFFAIQGWHSGRMGVDVFFCLSGLLMSRLLFQRRVPLGTFYKRRISRIIPAFLLYLLIVFVIAAVIGKAAPAREVVPTVLFLRSYLPADFHMFASPYPIGHLWSLNVEEHSYIFLSLLTLLPFLRGREGWALIGFGLLTIAIHLTYFNLPSIAPPIEFWVRSEVAATNLLLSAGYALLRDRTAPYVRPWMPVAAFAVATALYVGSVFPWMLTMTVAPFFLAFTVNHLAEAPRWVRAGLSLAPLRLLGIASFSIYLWQQPFYQYKKYLFDGLPAHALLGVVLAVAIGFLSFYAYEHRVRTWLNRVW
jgi:peptidoglycan/LPS O-acetylase OafA/YrhL